MDCRWRSRPPGIRWSRPPHLGRLPPRRGGPSSCRLEAFHASLHIERSPQGVSDATGLFNERNLNSWQGGHGSLSSKNIVVHLWDDMDLMPTFHRRRRRPFRIQEMLRCKFRRFQTIVYRIFKSCQSSSGGEHNGETRLDSGNNQRVEGILTHLAPLVWLPFPLKIIKVRTPTFAGYRPS